MQKRIKKLNFNLEFKRGDGGESREERQSAIISISIWFYHILIRKLLILKIIDTENY